MNEDYKYVKSNKLSIDEFNDKYGHLRPSSYDILSPSYRDRKDSLAAILKKLEVGDFS